MYAGIKVGPHDGIDILQQSGAKYCEIYFRLDWKEKYLPLFEFLKKQNINFGLHYWDMIEGKYLPNLMFLDDNICKKTYQSIKETIDIASQHGAYYVNFHPESYRLSMIDLDKKIVRTIVENKPVKRKEAFNQLKVWLKKIRSYAVYKKVSPLLETVPKNITGDFADFNKGRLHPQKAEGLETEKYYQLAKEGQLITIDIGHTLTRCRTEDRNKLFAYLMSVGKKLKDSVRLIHVTTNRPPLTDGVDSHNGILPHDFRQNVMPQKDQLMAFLKLFKDTDTWLIPEPPLAEMIENYLEFKKVVKQIEG